MEGDESLELSDKEIASAFADPLYAQRFPPVLTIEQVSDLLQIPVQTLYQWRSQGRLRRCCCKLGKHLRFYRNRLIKKAFNLGLTDAE